MARIFTSLLSHLLLILFLSLLLSFMCRQYKKYTQKFNSSIWKSDEILMLSLYCHTHTTSLSLFFHSLPAHLSLPLQGSEGCLCCRHLLISILACPYISSGVFLLSPSIPITFELSLAVWMSSDSCWQAWWHHYLSNQQPVGFSIAVNWCCPNVNSITGYVDVKYHRPDADIMDVTGRKGTCELTSKRQKRWKGLLRNGRWHQIQTVYGFPPAIEISQLLDGLSLILTFPLAPPAGQSLYLFSEISLHLLCGLAQHFVQTFKVPR